MTLEAKVLQTLKTLCSVNLSYTEQYTVDGPVFMRFHPCFLLHILETSGDDDKGGINQPNPELPFATSPICTYTHRSTQK